MAGAPPNRKSSVLPALLADKGGPRPSGGPSVPLSGAWRARFRLAQPPLTPRLLELIAAFGGRERAVSPPGGLRGLAKRLGVRWERLSKLLERLERLGLIEVRRPYRNRRALKGSGCGRGRSFALMITPKGASQLDASTKRLPVIIKRTSAKEEGQLRKRRSELKKRLLWYEKPYSERSRRLILMRTRVRIEQNEGLNGTREPLQRALCAAVWRALERERPPLMVEVEFSRLIEQRLNSWVGELVPLAKTPGRLYARAFELVDGALSEAFESVQDRKAGLRVLLEDVEARISAIENRSDWQPVGCPEAPKPAFSVPTELMLTARRKEEGVQAILAALDRLRPDGDGLERSPDGGEAGGDDVPLGDGLPEAFLDWLKRERPLSWAILLKDRVRLAQLWRAWRTGEGGALVATNAPEPLADQGAVRVGSEP